MKQDEFFKAKDISPEQWEQAAYSWDQLREVVAHHEERFDDLDKTAQYMLARVRTIDGAHAVKARVKDPWTVAEKIIRKRAEEAADQVAKPRQFTLDSYTTDLGDLIGLRIMHLEKARWSTIHAQLVKRFDVRDTPIFYHRRGDPLDEELLDRLQVKAKEHPRRYRSVHYIVDAPKLASTAYLAEIQVRTVAQDLWSEFDHLLNYGPGAKDPRIVLGLDLLNSLTAAADEACTFLVELDEWAGSIQASLAAKDRAMAEMERQIADLAQKDAAKAAAMQEALKQLSRSENAAFPVSTRRHTRLIDALRTPSMANIAQAAAERARLIATGADNLEAAAEAARQLTGTGAATAAIASIDGWVRCLECGMLFNTAVNEACPQCGRVP